MSKPVFNAKATPISSSPLTNPGEFRISLNIVDIEGVFSGLDIEVGDFLYLDTSALESATITRYKVLSVVSSTFTTATLDIQFLDDNDSVINPSVAIGIPGFISRPTTRRYLSIVPAIGTQLLPDKFSIYAQNQNFISIDKFSSAVSRVNIPFGAVSLDVVFEKPLETNDYAVICVMVNVDEPNPQFQPIAITNVMTTGFTAKWNAPVNSNNYWLAYIASPPSGTGATAGYGTGSTGSEAPSPYGPTGSTGATGATGASSGEFLHSWELNGEYGTLSFPQTYIDSSLFTQYPITIISAWIYNGTTGSAGITEFDLKYATGPGQSFSSIFSTTPKIAATTAISLTASGSTATATLANHGFINGESVTISEATQTEYNGTFTISNVTQNTFQYTVSGLPASPATGSPVVKTRPHCYTDTGSLVGPQAGVTKGALGTTEIPAGAILRWDIIQSMTGPKDARIRIYYNKLV